MSPWWLLVALGIFLIGVTKSGFGSGLGLMVVPVIVIAMGHIPGQGSDAALGLMLPLLIVGDVIAVYQYRHLFSLNIVKRLFPGTAIGVVLGGVLLWWFRHQKSDRLVGALIQIEVGCESMLLVGLHFYRIWRGAKRKLLPEPARGLVTGCFAAISSTLAHAAGPIIAMYLLPLRIDRQLFVGTSALYFFTLNAAKIFTYWLAGQFTNLTPMLAVEFLPLVVIGAIFGVWLNRRINERLFGTIVYVVTFGLGIYILVEGVHTLVRGQS
jgi:uncharacterized membrane protein YfcA